MRIALDYDGTYTSDPVLWLRFILDAQAAGHVVTVVTMRFASECVDAQFVPGTRAFDGRLRALGVEVVATQRKAKRPACAALGLEFDVWVDDNPQAVDQDAEALWPDTAHLAPEGQPVVPKYD